MRPAVLIPSIILAASLPLQPAVSVVLVSHWQACKMDVCLQLIPGMTKNGKQKTPDWLNKALGIKDEDRPKDVPRPQGFPDINGKPTT